MDMIATFTVGVHWLEKRSPRIGRSASGKKCGSIEYIPILDTATFLTIRFDMFDIFPFSDEP